MAGLSEALLVAETVQRKQCQAQRRRNAMGAKYGGAMAVPTDKYGGYGGGPGYGGGGYGGYQGVPPSPGYGGYGR